MEWKKRYG
jgi:hypothetical protein